MMINLSGVVRACDTLASRIITIDGNSVPSNELLDRCLKAFYNAYLPAEAITFRIYIAPPVNKPGEATIYNDGRLEMHTI